MNCIPQPTRFVRPSNRITEYCIKMTWVAELGRPLQRPVQRPLQGPVQRALQGPVQRPLQGPVQRPVQPRSGGHHARCSASNARLRDRAVLYRDGTAGLPDLWELVSVVSSEYSSHRRELFQLVQDVCAFSEEPDPAGGGGVMGGSDVDPSPPRPVQFVLFLSGCNFEREAILQKNADVPNYTHAEIITRLVCRLANRCEIGLRQ